MYHIIFIIKWSLSFYHRQKQTKNGKKLAKLIKLGRISCWFSLLSIIK